MYKCIDVYKCIENKSLPYVGSKMFTAFQGRVPIKLNNVTDKKPI